MKVDLHTHPLNHKYYGVRYPESIALTDQDKVKIEKFVNWCKDIRGLDAVALTDHDMIQSGVYAKTLDLGIEIITGAECQVYYDDEYVHILCLGITELPKYNWNSDPLDLIKSAHSIGGRCIMSHPMRSTQAFERCFEVLDGYEFINGGYKNVEHGTFYHGKEFLECLGHPLKPYTNSDFHYSCDEDLLIVPQQFNYMKETF